jgi:hypothetical protein
MAELIRTIEAQPRSSRQSFASTPRQYAITALIPYFPIEPKTVTHLDRHGAAP